MSALEILLRSQEERENDPELMEKIVGETKASAATSGSWEDLAASAPVAINCLAACFVAASSKKLEGKDAPMIPGATVERPRSLGGNLVECSNLGMKALMEANSRLLEIRMRSVIAQNKTSDILELLADARMAQKQLKTQMRIVKQTAEDCVSCARKIDAAFDAWLLFAKEFQTAWTQQGASLSEKALDDELRIAVEQVRGKKTENPFKRGRDRLIGILEAANATYRDASDVQPDGWDMVLKQVVSGIVDCTAQATQQAIPALAADMNPMARKDGESGLGITAPATRAQDPAYVQITKDLAIYDTLEAIINSENGGIDWAAGQPQGDKTKLSVIAFCNSMLKKSKSSFAQLASEQEPSIKYNSLLSDVSKIADELDERSKPTGQLVDDKPGKDSDYVKRRKSDWNTLYAGIYAMNTEGKALAGATSNSIPLYADNNQSRFESNQQNAVVKYYANRAATAAETLKSTSDVYTSASKDLSEQQKTFANINSELAQIMKENMDIGDARAILVQCVKLILTMKTQIVNMVAVFSALSETIGAVSDKPVNDLVTTISNQVTLQVGRYSLVDAQRSMMYSSCLTISAYFGIFADICDIWKDAHMQHLAPGLDMTEEIAYTAQNSPEETLMRAKRLAEWSRMSQGAIKNMIEERRQEMGNGMNERVESAQSVVRRLPPGTVPKAVQDSIAAAAAKTTEVVSAAATKQSLDKPINRLGVNRRED